MKSIIFAAAMLMTYSATAQITLTLDEALKKAQATNRTLLNAATDVDMAKEQVAEARANYLPEVKAQVLAFHSFDKLLKDDGTIPMEVAALGEQFAPLAGQPYSYGELNSAYSAMLTAVQPLYVGGQVTAGNKLAAVGRDVAELQQLMKQKDVEQRVTEAYWNIATVKYNLQTLDAADKQLSEVEKDVAVYVKAGLTTRNDLLKVQLRKHELESNRLKLNNAEHVLRLLLAQMVGMAGEDVDIDAATATGQISDVASPVGVRVDSEEAADQRPEMQLAQKAVEAQSLQVKMERGKLLPTVAVGVAGSHTGFGGLSDNVKQYVNTSMTSGFVFGTVSVPISAWWSCNHSVKRQKMKLRQAENDEADAREQLRIDVESAWSNLTEAHQQVGIARKSVEQAEENYRMVADQYKAGTIALSDLLDAETLRRQSHSQLATSVAKYQTEMCAYKLKTR